MNCWEYRKCGRERGGAKERELGSCPAYPDKGKSCADVPGTLCVGTVDGTSAVRMEDCTRCDFYRSPHYQGKRKLVEGYGAAPCVGSVVQCVPGAAAKAKT